MNDSRLYLGNLSYDTNESMSQVVFGEYWNITELNLIIVQLTRALKGFVFITFEKQSEVETTCKRLTEKLINSCSLQIDIAIKKMNKN